MLLTLLDFHMELARISTVREPAMALIRYAWWREGLEAYAAWKEVLPHETFLKLEKPLQDGAMTVEHLQNMIALAETALEQNLCSLSVRGLFQAWQSVLADAQTDTAVLAAAWDSQTPLSKTSAGGEKVWRAVAEIIHWHAQNPRRRNALPNYNRWRLAWRLLWRDAYGKI